MKTICRRLLAALLALTLIYSLSAAAFAAKGDIKTAVKAELQDTVVPVTVQMPFANVSLKVGENVDVAATVTGEEEGATYGWYSTDSNVVPAAARTPRSPPSARDTPASL